MPRASETVRFVSVTLSLFVAACSPWVPDSFPVTVDLDDRLTVEQKSAAIEACETWNQAVGRRVLRPVESNGRDIQRGRIAIRETSPRAGEIATSTANAWHCEIAVKGLGYDPLTMTHELGHCFGLEHDALTHSVMRKYSQPDQRLLPQHVDYVRELVTIAERRPTFEDP